MTGALAYFAIRAEPKIKATIEEKGSQLLGGPVTVQSVAIRFRFPMRLVLTRIKFESAYGLKGEFPNIELSFMPKLSAALDGKSALGDLDIKIEAPKIEFDPMSLLKNKPTHPEIPPNDQPIAIPIPVFPRDLGAKITIKNGQILYFMPGAKVETQELGFELIANSLQSMSVQLNSEGTVVYTSTSSKETKDDSGWRIPFKLRSKAIELDQTHLRSKSFEAMVAGIETTNAFKFDLSTSAFNFSSLILTDLTKQMLPPAFLPPARWRGQISGKIEAARTRRTGPIDASFEIHSPNLSGTVGLQQVGFSAHGPLNAEFEAKGRVIYKANTPLSLDMERLRARFDANQLELKKDGLFAKPAGLPAQLTVLGDGTPDGLVLRDSELKLANLTARASGRIKLKPGQDSHLKIEMNRTSLAGWEKYILPLSTQPVTGAVELLAYVRGDLQNPKNLTMTASPLKFEQLRATLKYSNADKTMKLEGPVAAHGIADFEVRNMEVARADLQGQAELSALAAEVHSGKTVIFKKAAGSTLNLAFLAQAKSGNQLVIKKADLNALSSRFHIEGRLSDLANPRFHLTIKPDALQLADAVTVSPMLAESLQSLLNKPLSGKLVGALVLDGQFTPNEGIEKSPIRLEGQLNVGLPLVSMLRPPPAPSSTTTTPSPPEPEHAILPEWPVVRSAKIDWALSIPQLIYGTADIRGIHLEGQMRGTQLQAFGKIEKAFGGMITIKDLKTRLTTNRPDITTDLQIRDLNISPALEFIKPEFKDMARGQLIANANLFVPFPGGSDFMTRLSASGQMLLRQGFVSTMSLDGMVNEALAKIPGVGKNQVGTKGVAADITSDFSLKTKVLNLTKFIFLTPEKNELKASGIISLYDFGIDLLGIASLMNAPVGDSVRAANSDSMGRFTIPIKIKGNLLKPQASFADESIKKITENTMRYEASKAQEQVKKRAQEEVKKQLNQGADRLKEELKKRGLPF